MDGLGGRFWLYTLAIALAVGIGGLVFFMFISAAWASWGLFGALLFFGAVALVWGWYYDRQHPRYRDPTT